jgi:DNA-binding phage protein
MSSRKKTGAERFFEKQMSDPEFAAAYEQARSEIDATDQIIRALDKARVEANISKAELARRIGAAPEHVRKLFTASGQNPTVTILTKMARALDCKLQVVKVTTIPRRRSDHSKDAA